MHLIWVSDQTKVIRCSLVGFDSKDSVQITEFVSDEDSVQFKEFVSGVFKIWFYNTTPSSFHMKVLCINKCYPILDRVLYFLIA